MIRLIMHEITERYQMEAMWWPAGELTDGLEVV